MRDRLIAPRRQQLGHQCSLRVFEQLRQGWAFPRDFLRPMCNGEGWMASFREPYDTQAVPTTIGQCTLR